MKLLLLGKDGQVGQALQSTLAPLGELLALGRTDADLSHPKTLAPLIEQARPDVIVNAAAYTAVDAAEDERDLAWPINAGAVGAIGEAAKRVGALVVHYSTDYVFDGLAPGYFDESAPTSPLSVYGASKLAGEVLLRESGADHLIFRASWVYASRGKNFPLTILRLAKERDSLSVVSDQIGSPTSADLVADITAHSIPRVVADHSLTGLYHLAPGGETNWHDYAQLLLAEALAAGATLRAGPDDIVPIASADYPAKAKRPSNSRLDTSKLRAAFDLKLPTWQEGVRRLINVLRVEERL